MMYTEEDRVEGLCKDRIVKLAPVVYSGAMKIATNQGHYNTNRDPKWRGLQQRDNSK